MGLIADLISRAKRSPAQIVLPEGEDDRVGCAAKRLAAEGIARPVLLGHRERILGLFAESGPSGVSILDPKESSRLSRYVEVYARRRSGISPGAAARLMKRPLFFGAMMVSEGDADAMVAGASTTTGRVISAAALAIGYQDGVSRPSSFFIMVLPGPPERAFVFADAAVSVEPSPTELAEIAVVTAYSARRLLSEVPRVAMLSFSTYGSASHPRVERIQKAVQIARSMDPDLIIDGEIQADAALSARVASKKCPDSPLKGDANVLIFPDLDAGNIGYKLVQQLACAQAIGPIMQGFRRPVFDLSRGATSDDIVALCAIASLQAQGRGGKDAEPR